MKEYKPVFYRAKGDLKNQSVLSDLSWYLNFQENHGWTARCTQYTGATGFLIILEREITASTSVEVQDYITRVQSEGGDVTGTLRTAYQNLYKSIQSIRAKTGRINLFATDNFSGFNVPFIHSFDGTNIVGNAVDINNNFMSADYDLQDGLTGNGATKYLQTGFNPAVVDEVSLNNFGFFVWMSAYPGISSTMYDIGCITSAIVANNSSELLVAINSGGQSVPATPELGFLWVGRQNGTEIEITLNGANYTVAAASLSEPNFEMFVFGLNNSGTLYSPSNRTLQGYGITKYLTPSERSQLFNAITNFNLSIGR